MRGAPCQAGRRTLIVSSPLADVFIAARFTMGTAFCLLCSDARLSPPWVWLLLCMWAARNYGRSQI